MYKAKKKKQLESLVTGTPEDSLYILKGFMYYVRHEHQSDGDCDLHIEIGTADRTAFRAIVEVTRDNCILQKKILDFIYSKGYATEKEFPSGIPVVVKGLGFWDGHSPAAEHGRHGKTNISCWELHPVEELTIN